METCELNSGKSHIDVDNYEILYSQWRVVKLNAICRYFDVIILTP